MWRSCICPLDSRSAAHLLLTRQAAPTYLRCPVCICKRAMHRRLRFGTRSRYFLLKCVGAGKEASKSDTEGKGDKKDSKKGGGSAGADTLELCQEIVRLNHNGGSSGCGGVWPSRHSRALRSARAHTHKHTHPISLSLSLSRVRARVMS